MVEKKSVFWYFSFSFFIFSEQERIFSICIKYIKKEVVSGPLFRYVIVEKTVFVEKGRQGKESGTSFYLGNFT